MPHASQTSSATLDQNQPMTTSLPTPAHGSAGPAVFPGVTVDQPAPARSGAREAHGMPLCQAGGALPLSQHRRRKLAALLLSAIQRRASLLRSSARRSAGDLGCAADAMARVAVLLALLALIEGSRGERERNAKARARLHRACRQAPTDVCRRCHLQPPPTAAFPGGDATDLSARPADPSPISSSRVDAAGRLRLRLL